MSRTSKSRLRLEMRPQPDDSTCGPTCLHAVYRFYADRIPLRQVIAEVVPLETGGTLAVHLGCHALRRGYTATIFTYNLQLFDPTWFYGNVDLAERLHRQAEVKHDRKLRSTTKAYLEFLSLGGRLRFEELRPALLRRFLKRQVPVLTGLSATYLYGCAREVGDHKLHPDDISGVPTGHFVVLCGYDRDTRDVLVADPYADNPPFGSHYYDVGVERVLGAILLGVMTYDANLLIVERTTHARA
jgi:hypothetical protein